MGTIRWSWMVGLFLLGACGGPKPLEGDDAGECRDGADNDVDGLFDCDDDDCFASPDCALVPPTGGGGGGGGGGAGPGTGTSTGTGTGTGTGSATTSDTGSWTGAGTCVDLKTISMALTYGWDESLGQTRSYTPFGGTSTPSQFTLGFGLPGWTGDPAGEVCRVSWNIDGLAGTPGVAPYAIELDLVTENADVMVDTCTPLLPSVCQPTLLVAPVGSFVDGESWVVEMGGPDDYFGLYYYPDHVWGGRITSSLVATDFDVFGIGFSVDAGFVGLGTDADIAAVDMPGATTQIDGIYQVFIPWFVILQ